ncbi:MAG TPA: fibronectin [Bacteroidota bacterium]|nr:fibronectin [Bacteroidota bacterium]
MSSISRQSLGFALAACLVSATVPTSAQVPEAEKRYVRVGTLQSRFSAYGAERAWNDVYYEGLTWPSDYNYTDNAVIERQWIGCQDFTDAKAQVWENYCVAFTQAFAGSTVFPMVHRQSAKVDLPFVLVDGTEINAPYRGESDEVNTDQIPDRIITNVVNTSMGVTMTRRILAFSQQWHDNYFIKEFTFKNTGYVNATNQKVLNATVKGFRFGFGVRYSVSREGSFSIGGDQTYGKHSWITRRGETYAQHAGDVLTEASPIPQWLRAGYSWAGQSEVNTFDNIGGQNKTGDGRLRGPQFAGIAVLHADRSATDRTDDPAQPNTLGWHAGDTYPSLGDMTLGTMPFQIDMYKMLSGVAYRGQGHPTERMDEMYMATKPDPYVVHGDGGGTNLWINFGPYDLAPGDSVVIVLAEGVAGLDRQKCSEVGALWKKAEDDPTYKGPFTLPNGSTTDDRNVYKNTWFYTGRDSIMLTFSRAKRCYDLGYQIPQPPLPPPQVSVTSGGDRISLSWVASPSESSPGFGGYKVFRATGKTDTTFQEIASLGPGSSAFDDVTAQRGFSYYYYVSAFSDGSANASGGPNPSGPLLSTRFYTRTNQPAYLRRQAGESLSSIRIVPNPYNIAAPGAQYPGEPDKIMFLNIPGHCTIRIYTENGDLINQIEHENGSGDETWNSNTSSRQVVVSGIYIVHFTVTADYADPTTGELKYKNGETAYQKLIVIR